MSSPTRVQQLWEHFVQAEHNSYEKQGWLDIFLAEFLAQIKEGKTVDEILSFCAPGGVATLIGCELLSDVHKICSLPGDGEDLSLLRKHFLQGRGWRSLATLQCLGVKNLSCGRELASLLISLYPVCLRKLAPEQKENMTAENPFIVFSQDLGSIDLISKLRSPPKSKGLRSVQQGLCPPIRAELMRSHSNTSTRTNRSGRRSRTPMKVGISPGTVGGLSGDTTAATSDSEHCSGMDSHLDQLNKCINTLRIRLDPMDFDYFTSVVRSEDEARLDRPDYTPTRRRPGRGEKDFRLRSLTPTDFEDSRTRDVLSSGIHCYEFFRLVIDLLRSLCGTELNGITMMSGNGGQHIPLQVVNFALENLCTLQFGGNSNLVPVQVAELKAAITRLLLTALEKILLHPEATMTAIRNGMLPVMLKILEDAVRKISAEAEEPDENRQATHKLEQEFVFGTAYGILMFLYSLLLQRSTVDKFQDFLQLFQLFSESHGGRLIEKTVITLLSLSDVEAQQSTSRAKKVIDLVGQLVNALKKVRGEIVHSHDCRRARHKRCVNQASGGLHHHYDLLGAPFSPVLVGPCHPTCSVASLFMVLVRILTSTTATTNIRPHVLRVMTQCGTCCCFPTRSIVAPLIDLFKNGNSGKVRTLGFALLERTIYLELGAISNQDTTVSCVFCNRNFLPKSNLTEFSTDDAIYETAICRRSEHSSNEKSLSTDMEKSDGEVEVIGRSSWECLELYRDLILSDDNKLIHSVTSHLLKIAPRCTPSVKHRLLFKIFFPTFISAKESFFKSKKCNEENAIAKFNLLSSLSAFSSILSSSIIFAKEFISQYNGLNHILDLISLLPFAKVCCSILEVMAIVEIWKLEFESGNLDSDVGELPSLCMLQKAIQTATSQIFVALGISSSSGESSPESSGNSSYHDASESQPKENYLENQEDEEILETKFEAAKESYLQLLKTVSVFWRTCANLVLYSPQYRQHLSHNQLSHDAYTLLQVLLEKVTSATYPPGTSLLGYGIESHSETHLYMKLIESTLIIALKAPPLHKDSATHSSALGIITVYKMCLKCPFDSASAERCAVSKNDDTRQNAGNRLKESNTLFLGEDDDDDEDGGESKRKRFAESHSFVPGDECNEDGDGTVCDGRSKLSASNLNCTGDSNNDDGDSVRLTEQTEWKGLYSEFCDVVSSDNNVESSCKNNRKSRRTSGQCQNPTCSDKVGFCDDDCDSGTQTLSHYDDNEEDCWSRHIHDTDHTETCEWERSFTLIISDSGTEPHVLSLIDNIDRWRCSYPLLFGCKVANERDSIQVDTVVGDSEETKCKVANEKDSIQHDTMVGDSEETKCGLKSSLTQEMKCRLKVPLIIVLGGNDDIDDGFSDEVNKENGISVGHESVLESIQRALLSVNVDRMNMRQLCDVLLKCAVAQSCREQVMPPNNKKQLKISPHSVGGGGTWDEGVSEGVSDEDEVEACNGSEGGSEAYVTADEGYEADVEVQEGCGINNIVGAGEVEEESSSSLATAPPILIQQQLRATHNIAHPALCLLAVELLVHLNKRYYEMPAQAAPPDPERPNESTHLQSLVHCIQRLVVLCRDNPQNCMLLANSDLTIKLLKGFAPVLTVSEVKFSELQRIILELVTLLARYNISPRELSLFLNFFKADDPPLGPLLTALTGLITSSHAQPNYILCFPTVEPLHHYTGRRSSSSPESPPPDNNEASSQALKYRSQHLQNGVKSCWSQCALTLPLNQDLGWSMWLQGFSLSMWMRLENRGTSSEPGLSKAASYSTLSDSSSISDWNNYQPKEISHQVNGAVGAIGGKSSSKEEPSLHVFSIGYEALILEVWAGPATGVLSFRLTRPDTRSYEILSESKVEGMVGVGQWHHLAVNARDYIHARKTVIEIVLIVDGWQETKVLLPFSGLLVRKSKPTSFLLGHTVTSDCEVFGSWYLGNVMLFRSPVFTKERAVYLVGLGPNYTNLTDCSDVDRLSPNFTNVFGPKTLFCGIDWDAVLDGKKGNLKELQDNLLLTYCTQNHNVVNLYPQVITNPGGVVASLFPGQPGFRVVTMDQRASQQLPLSIFPTLFVPMNPRRYQGLVAAASILGGTPVFLFLFARVVELKASEEFQARTLYLLLKLVQSDSELFSQFVSQDCHKLLLKVLQSPRCTAGHHMLKAVLDTCCDKSVLQYQPSPHRFFIVNRSDAVIVNSFLLTTIVGSWRDWERATAREKSCVIDEEGGGVLGTLFRTLHVLLRDDHPFREFNAAQLNRVHMVEALLLFCKERFLYEESIQLHMSVCCSLVELIRSLMGSPPEFSHIVAVTDFLVLLHRASSTYITHVRSSFYFLLSPVPQEKNQLAISIGGSATNTKPGPSPRPAVRGKPGADNDASSKASKKPPVESKDVDFAQPVDPQKLNKALTNLQIKQNSLDGGSMEAAENIQNLVDSNRTADKDIGGLDSGIAGSYRETSSDIAASLDGNKKADSFTDSADKLLACAEQATFFSIEGGIILKPEEEKEKFTTETGEMKEPIMVSPWCDDMFVDGQDDTKDNEPYIAIGEGEKGLVVEGLLLLLRDTLLILPDNMAHQVLNHVVKAEYLLIMANHSDSRVRMAVVKVLSAYLHRSTDEEINKFLKMKGFYQLANQLSLFPASLELVEACVSLVTRCNVALEEQTEVPSLTEMSFLQLNSFPPLLALLPRAVHDVALTHNMILFLRDLFAKVPESIKPMLDCGLLEVLCRTLVAIAHLAPQPTDVCGMSEQDILFGDIHVFMVTLSAHVLHTPGANHMQIVNDLQLQLNFMEKLERNTCGPQARCVSALREALCVLLEGELDIIQEMITFLAQPPGTKLINSAASYISAVLSPNYDVEQSLNVDLEMRGFPNTGSISNSSSFNSTFGGNCNGKNSSSNSRSEMPRGEINERFKTIITKSVEFLVNAEPGNEHNMSGCCVEQNFARRLFTTMLQGLSSVLDKRNSGHRSTWSSVMWAARDLLRVQAANLMLWLLSPFQPVKLRTFAIWCVLRAEPRCKELLTTILHTHAQNEHKLSVFLWDLLHTASGHMSGNELKACQDFSQQLQDWGLSSPHAGDVWDDELRILLADVEKQRQQYEKQNEAATNRSVFKFEQLMNDVSKAAMSITRMVVDAQNAERKGFMDHIKHSYSENVQIRIKWQKIIQQLTHERAVWFFPDSYPRSWQLDSTEGPARVRNRLQRCHLGIQKKYLMPAAQRKLDAVKNTDPLSYLFEQDKKSSTSSVLIERLHTNEKIQHMCTVKLITPANEVPGELLIGESSLYFVADDSMLETDLAEVTAGSLDVSSTAWPFENVKEIHNRRFQLQERALEIFLLNGKTYLVAFQSSKERDDFAWELAQCQLPNRVAGDNLSDAVQLWRQGLLTNWEYLTQLNKMAGRSYNDLMQYPVFPFVLSNYTSDVLDLTDPKNYRNFKKPMAVQDKKNEQHYVNNYNYLKQELKEGFHLVSLNQEPYHYGSHYSNSGTVLHFLVRLPPFTRMFLTYQDQNFDLPDRTFHSLHTTWRLTSSDSTTDVKELIPEFFFLPEFLRNSEDFDFGTRQSGDRVNDVELPPWCHRDARRFVLIHRQALESAHARENLPLWIDLVFGFKQTGKAAVEAINVFHPATYCGFEVEKIKDPLERTAWKTMVKTYGQTPRQLFRSAHPMVEQSLASRASSVREVVRGVKGLLWGSYVGSPADPDPVVVWKHTHRTPVASLVPLLTNDVFGLGPHTSILLRYSKEKGLSMVNATSVLGAALVTWGHADGVVRVKLKKEQPPWPVVKSPGLDPICICASMPDCNQLWMGHWSGKLIVYEYKFSPSHGSLNFGSEPITLLGHEGPIQSIYICRSFSIVVTGSQDGTAIIWDLNNLSYIRCIAGNNMTLPVNLVSVSETVGDVALVCSMNVTGLEPPQFNSLLRLYSINAVPIGMVQTRESITAICFSGAPEGVSVNVIAAGLSTGVIRLWSTWDLSPVRDISTGYITRPIVSLTYSQDAQHLYASVADGTVVIWEGGGGGSSLKGISKTPKFLNLTSL